jgi:NADH-ubiquinone oxidoreductase chain 6
MYTLFLLLEDYTNGYTDEFLDLFSLFSILCGIFVIISKNPIISVLFLIGLFLSIAGYLIMLGVTFIGLSYLLVYVGAVSILFLFILMLINIRISELLGNTNNSLPLGIIISIFIYANLYKVFFFNIEGIINNIYRFFEKKDKVFYVTSRFWDGSLAEASHITSIGNVMYTSHFIWLIITSIILLLAMVGAIVITIKQKSLPVF